MSSIIEVQGVATDRNDTFPYSGMRVLGSLQIGVGILVFALGVADLALTLTSYESDLQKHGSRYEKVGFLILNVLCCSLFGPICAGISGYISYIRHDLARGDFQWLLNLTICFVAVLEAAIATVSAAVTCCCSTLRATQVHVLVNPRHLLGQDSDSIRERKTSNISAISAANITNNSNNLADSSALNNSNSSKANLSLPRSNKHSTTSNPRHLLPIKTLVNDISEYQPRQQPRIELQEPVTDGFGFTSGYQRWRKWTIHQ